MLLLQMFDSKFPALTIMSNASQNNPNHYYLRGIYGPDMEDKYNVSVALRGNQPTLMI